MTPRICRSVVALAVLVVGGSAAADEGGVPFWLSGQFASLAAVPQSPGISVPVMFYYYQGNTDPDPSKAVQRSGKVTANLKVREPILYLSPTWVPNFEFLGGRPAFSLTFGMGRDRETGDIAGPMGGQFVTRTDSAWGITDLYPLVSLAWQRGINNGMAYASGDLPTGSYDSTRLANVGIGHFAGDVGGGYTLHDSNKTGVELSAVAGFTFNGANWHTHYKNGIDFHLDYAVSEFLTKRFQLGAVGYLYYQLTDDSGSGDTVGPSRSKVSAVGGEAGYFFKAAGHQWYANVRGYWEYWAENRPQGFAIFGVLAIPMPLSQ